MVGTCFKMKINVLLYDRCFFFLCSVCFYEADKFTISDKSFLRRKFLYVVDMSESSNNKTTGLRKNKMKNGKLTTIMIVVTLKRAVNLV